MSRLDPGLDYGSSDGDPNLFCDSGIKCDNNNNNSCWEAGAGNVKGGKDMDMDMDMDIDFG